MTQTLVPFGVRQAVTIVPDNVATLVYDPERQINFTVTDGSLVEAAKHSDGKTNTKTASQDATGADSDEDVTED